MPNKWSAYEQARQERPWRIHPVWRGIGFTKWIRLLAKLDLMKIIGLQPGNRVRLKVHKHFQLIPGGPIQNFYYRKLLAEFLQSKFKEPGEYLNFLSGMFSRAAHAEIIRKVRRLEEDVKDLRDESDSLPLDERFGFTMLMAIRPWEPDAFEELRRAPNPKKF